MKIKRSTHLPITHISSLRARERSFLKKVHGCISNGGKVLIPVFALGRAQVRGKRRRRWRSGSCRKEEKRGKGNTKSPAIEGWYVCCTITYEEGSSKRCRSQTSCPLQFVQSHHYAPCNRIGIVHFARNVLGTQQPASTNLFFGWTHRKGVYNVFIFLS